MLRHLFCLAFVASAAHAQPVRSDLEVVTTYVLPSGADPLVVLEGGSPVALEGVPGAEPTSRSAVSPAGAVFLSLGATTGFLALGAQQSLKGDPDSGITLALTGLMLGPSVGNLILGEHRDAAIGAGVRTIGAGILAGLWYTEYKRVGTFDLSEEALGAAVIAATVTLLSGTVYDLSTAGANARRARIRPAGAGLALEVRL